MHCDLVNRGSDELNEFRLRNCDNSFIQNIKFISKKSLSRATEHDLELVYDGPKGAELINKLLPNYSIQNLHITKVPSTKSFLSIPSNANIVDVRSGDGYVTCLALRDVLQVAISGRNIFALCPFGCDAEDTPNSPLNELNPMKLHRFSV